MPGISAVDGQCQPCTPKARAESKKALAQQVTNLKVVSDNYAQELVGNQVFGPLSGLRRGPRGPNTTIGDIRTLGEDYPPADDNTYRVHVAIEVKKAMLRFENKARNDEIRARPLTMVMLLDKERAPRQRGKVIASGVQRSVQVEARAEPFEFGHLGRDDCAAIRRFLLSSKHAW